MTGVGCECSDHRNRRPIADGWAAGVYVGYEARILDSPMSALGLDLTFSQGTPMPLLVEACVSGQLTGATDSELTHLLRSFKVMANKRAEYLTLLN